jgi:hypothetical protein
LKSSTETLPDNRDGVTYATPAEELEMLRMFATEAMKLARGTTTDPNVRWARSQADTFQTIARGVMTLRAERVAAARPVTRPAPRESHVQRQRRHVARATSSSDPGDDDPDPVWLPCPVCRQPLVEKGDDAHCGGCPATFWGWAA